MKPNNPDNDIPIEESPLVKFDRVWGIERGRNDEMLKANGLHPSQGWPSASCCGEPRVSKDVDACYDHAVVCKVCRENPAAPNLSHCPTCATGTSGSPAAQG